jgi:nicotinate-nucleotide pyrophosphorylase
MVLVLFLFSHQRMALNIKYTISSIYKYISQYVEKIEQKMSRMYKSNKSINEYTRKKYVRDDVNNLGEGR